MPSPPELPELQHRFIEAIFGAGEDRIAQWIVPGGLPVSARFAVYRNNVFHNLREALREVYPVVERLVGRAFFDHASDRFIGDFGSGSGDLHRFGGDFASFLASYPAAGGLPYLADTARLEWLIHQAFHAADHAALPIERLRSLAADDYERLQFRMHPACRLLASDYPLLRIWEVNQPSYRGQDTVDLALGRTMLLVRRPGHAISVDPLWPGEFALLSRLAAGDTLGEAVESACAAEPGFDLGEALHRNVRSAILVDVGVGRP